MKKIRKNSVFGLPIIMGAAAIFTPATVWADDATLDEIVVTAQKRSQNLQDVGIAITAFTGSNLEELGISRVGDLAAQTAGMSIKNSLGKTNPVITIRGIGMNDFKVNSAPSTAVHVNDVFLGSSAFLSFQMFDVGRVEVLKGPQGTLYGRNTTAGAVNIITNKPTEEFEAALSFDYGNFNSIDAEGFISGAISENLTARLAFMYSKSNGHQKIVGTETAGTAGFALAPAVPGVPSVADDDSFGGHDVFAWRGSLSWQPSENLDVEFKIHGSRERSDQLLKELTGEYQGFSDPDSDVFSGWSNLRPKIDSDGIGASLHINWDMGFATLTSVTGYEDFDRVMEDDDGIPIRRGEAIYNEDLWQWTQEIRLASNDDGNVSWILGAFISEDEIDLLNILDFSDWQLLGPGSTRTSTFVETNYIQKGSSLSFFGHSVWQLASDLKLTFGLRYTEEDKSLKGESLDQNPYGLSIVGPAFGLPLEYDNDYSASDVSGKLALDWTPNDNTLVYASVSKGFKSGGFDGSVVLNIDSTLPYKEETVWAYEIGFKSTSSDNKFQLNGAAFYYDYDDMQVSKVVQTGLGFDSVRSNADKTRIYGAELEMWWKPSAGLDIKAGASYINSEITLWTDDLSSCGTLPGGGVDPTCPILVEKLDREGNEVPDAPNLTFNGLVRYQWGLSNGMGLISLVDFNYTDKMFKDVSNELVTDSYLLVNARLTLKSSEDTWSASLWVKNIGNKHYIDHLFSPAADVRWNWYGMPRTYGINVKYHW